jgi:transketolase
MNLVSRPHARSLVRFAGEHPELLVLSADLTASCEADDFRDAYPDRFVTLGMAEQNLIGVAAGLAREGFVPYVHTFAVFLTRRVYDQVAMSVAYPNLRVRLVGFLPGLTTPGGVTHQATDDVALMRALPNMTVVDVGDATEVESTLQAIHDVDGPVYVRMLRGQVPRLFPSTEPLSLGQPRILSRGHDLVVLSSGICTESAVRAVRALAVRGVSASLVHVSTLKPFGGPWLNELLDDAKMGAITLENHSVIGGLGSAVAEWIAERGKVGPLRRLGVQDVFAQGASLPYLLAKHGLDARAVVQAAEELLGARLNVPDDELACDVTLPDEGRVEEL